MKNRQEYIQQAKSSLDGLNAKIDDLESDLVTKRIKVDAALKSKLDELKLRRMELGARIEKLKDASDESWHSLRESTDKVFNELRHTYSEVKDKLLSALS